MAPIIFPTFPFVLMCESFYDEINIIFRFKAQIQVYWYYNHRLYLLKIENQNMEMWKLSLPLGLQNSHFIWVLSIHRKGDQKRDAHIKSDAYNNVRLPNMFQVDF